MKKTYLEPKIEVVRLKMEGMICTSMKAGEDWGTTEQEAGSREGKGFFDE